MAEKVLRFNTSNRVRTVSSVSSASSASSASSVAPGQDNPHNDLEELLRNGDRNAILQRLSNVRLGSALKRSDKSLGPTRTVFRAILQNTTNGDKILLDRLDKCVQYTTDNKDTLDHAIQVDVGQFEETGNYIDIIKDLLDYTDTRVRQVLLHPVMQIFLEFKWRSVQDIFFFTFMSYFVFILTYSLYLGNIFYRRHLEHDPDVDNGTWISRFLVENEHNITNAFESCKNPGTTCFLEVLLFASLIAFYVKESFKMMALGLKRYFLEFENILELTVLTLATAGFWNQQSFTLFKWLSVIGVCLAYLELIFLMGRYPFLGGKINVMFYGIMRHIAKSLLSLFVLVTGFAFSFFIIHHDKRTKTFENPWRAAARTLAMVLGEFEFNSIYESHGDDVFSRAFTIFLMIALAVIGSLVLINLIVALIVSDIGPLKTGAHLQELINKGRHVITLEHMANYSRLGRCCFKRRRTQNVPRFINICCHSLCNNCPAKKVDSELVRSLIKILDKREILCAVSKWNPDDNRSQVPKLQTTLTSMSEFQRDTSGPINEADHFVSQLLHNLKEKRDS